MEKKVKPTGGKLRTSVYLEEDTFKFLLCFIPGIVENVQKPAGLNFIWATCIRHLLITF